MDNQTKRIDIPVERLREVDSTNNYLAALCKDSLAKEFHTVVAESQTAGKGQRGNSWESEDGKNLTFSTVVFPTALKARDQFNLSMITALSILCVLNEYTEGFSIKWPNDIYWKDQKIAGILIENELEGEYVTQSIIGIGLNVNQQVFLSNAPNPVSMRQILGPIISRKEILQKLLSNFTLAYEHLEDDFEEMAEETWKVYQSLLYRNKGFHTYRDAKGLFKAQIEQVEPDGHLCLRDEENQIRRYMFKEVTFILHE